MNNPKGYQQRNANSIHNKNPQWQHGTQQQEKQTPTANYTLPGVINYLTSEFTNLERFKIMTNLEISEMKYRIMHLHGELNSAKYINENQKLRIEELEKENKKLKCIINDTEKDSSDNIINNEPEIKTIEIPEVDLSAITRSRDQLTNSMKEIMSLLNVPTKAYNNINLNDFSSNNHYQDLISEDNNSLSIIANKDEQEFPQKLNKKKIFSQYLKESTSIDNLKTEDKLVDEALQDIFENNTQTDDTAIEGKTISDYESDSNTVIFDSSEDQQSLVPQATIEYKHKNFPLSKIDFNDSYITYLNYDEYSKVPISELTIWSIESNHLIHSITGLNPFTDNPTKIIQMYTFFCSKTKCNIILIYNSGIIEHLTINNNKFSSKSRNIHLASNSTVFSADIVEVTKSQGQSSKQFGLIICTGIDKITDLKVSHLIIDTDINEIELIEMGDYNQEFFKDLNQVDQNNEFLYAHWYKESASPVKNDNNVSNVHINYLHYKIILKFNASLILLNIESNSFEELLLYNSAEIHYKGLAVSNYKLLVEKTPQDDYYKAKLFDIVKREVVSSIDVNSPNVILTEYQENILIVELSDDKLIVSDTFLHQKKNISVESSYKIDSLSSKILLYSNPNILRVYELDDSFKVA